MLFVGHADSLLPPPPLVHVTQSNPNTVHLRVARRRGARTRARRVETPLDARDARITNLSARDPMGREESRRGAQVDACLLMVNSVESNPPDQPGV